MTTSVYVASAGRNRIKIGVSGNVAKRMTELSSAAGARVSLEAFRVADAPLLVERMAHWLLREKHRHGEWFNVTVGEAKAALELAIEMVGAGEVAPNPGFGGMGRPKQFTERMHLTLPEGTQKRATAVLEGGRTACRLPAKPTSERSSAASASPLSPTPERMDNERVATD